MGGKWFSWSPKSRKTVDFSHKIKRHLLLGSKGMTNLGSILKRRDITLPTKVHVVKAIVFPVVMYRCESWTIKKTECQRTDAFRLWCWTAMRSSQSILKKNNPDYSLEGLILKLQYFGHLMWSACSVEKTLILERIEGRRKGRLKMKQLDSITDSMYMSLC